MEQETKYKTKSIRRTRDYRGMQIVREEIASELYKRGYTYRDIRREVMARLNLQTYSLDTVHRDINRMLAEAAARADYNMDEMLQLELARIDDMMREAWEAWEKSKQDYLDNIQVMRGVPKGTESESSIQTTSMEQRKKDVRACGDPRYLEIIHKLSVERRKLLGLYAPEKREISGSAGFMEMLMATSTDSTNEDK